jgi:hypothetical protein
MHTRAAALLIFGVVCVVTAVIVVISAASCHGCREGHPYVPYAIGSSQAATPAAAASAPIAIGAPGVPGAADAGRPSFIGEAATLAPPDVSTWPVDDVVLQAGEGRVFVSALVRDFDGDGARDAFAIERTADGSDAYDLAYYRGQKQANTLQASSALSPPAGLSRSPGCNMTSRLVGVGKASVLVELGAACGLSTSSAPDRWVALVGAAGQDAKVRLAVTIADPRGAATLSVEGDATDRDGDGLDDVALRVTIEGGDAPLEPGPRVGAVFAWLDRTAGLSRDIAATETSFASLAATAAARAVRAKEAPGVSVFVAQVRALWRSTCADGGAPRVVGVAGTGAITCGAARALEDLGLAEVRAYVTNGDALRATLALDRAQRHPASRTAPRAIEAQRWISRLAPVANARAVRAVSAVPAVGAGHEPAWGALAFEPNGKLLVRTRAGVVRVDPDAGDETAAEGAADWKTAVTSPEGTTRWIETYDPCDGLPLRATFAPTGGDDLHDVALPVAPPLGARCVGSRGALARTLPIAWGPMGIEAIVEGQLVLISRDLAHAALLATLLGQPAAPGAPRSPDGKTLVVATDAGLLVQGAGHARLLRAPELDGTYGDQRDCAVGNDGSHVACVRAGKAWVGAWD